VFWRARRGKKDAAQFLKSPIPVCCGIAYLTLALVMTMAARLPGFGKSLPTWLFDAFNSNDKTNLAPYPVLHFVVMVFVVTRFVSKDWRGLEWQIFKPVIICGQQSLAVFCVGVFHARRLLHLMVQATGRSAPHGIRRCSFMNSRAEIHREWSLARPCGRGWRAGSRSQQDSEPTRCSPFAASNERETGKNCPCAPILIVFRRNSDVV
jgi:hypothetical protein